MRCTTCGDDPRAGDLYGHGRGEPVAAETEMPADDNGLTVRLPAPTRIRLTLGPTGGGNTT
ncbi:hypothetical protein [Streptomyces europaeiscabiei]|uniref:hypothetical protein n=1 Tax=Streptomyces europaeiscabiei TaxID=146819 RepID=UPI0029CA575B|nr:hypothetical protein [Streptomyces europaeiscabiei]